MSISAELITAVLKACRCIVCPPYFNLLDVAQMTGIGCAENGRCEHFIILHVALRTVSIH